MERSIRYEPVRITAPISLVARKMSTPNLTRQIHEICQHFHGHHHACKTDIVLLLRMHFFQPFISIDHLTMYMKTIYEK